jgi:hypothetical protein
VWSVFLDLVAGFLFLFFVLFAVGIVVGGNEEGATGEGGCEEEKRISTRARRARMECMVFMVF